MKSRLSKLILLSVIFAVLTACGPSQAEIDTAATQAAATAFTAQTATAPTDTSTPVPTNTTTPIPPTETPLPSATPNQAATDIVATRQAFLATRQVEHTATAVAAQSTQQAEDATWAQLVSDGTVTYAKGDLFTPDDFEESWAQRNWYQWWYFGYDMANFVLMSHIEWKIPEDAVWGIGGCGFVTRLKNKDNHLIIFLTPKGNAELGANTPSGVTYQGVHWQNPEIPSYANIQPQLTGSADFMIVAEKEFVSVYIDGVRFYQWFVALTSPGDIAYTIVSGTNKDFGINCKFTNTRIWELVKQ